MFRIDFFCKKNKKLFYQINMCFMLKKGLRFFVKQMFKSEKKNLRVNIKKKIKFMYIDFPSIFNSSAV